MKIGPPSEFDKYTFAESWNALLKLEILRILGLFMPECCCAGRGRDRSWIGTCSPVSILFPSHIIGDLVLVHMETAHVQTLTIFARTAVFWPPLWKVLGPFQGPLLLNVVQGRQSAGSE